MCVNLQLHNETEMWQLFTVNQLVKEPWLERDWHPSNILYLVYKTNVNRLSCAEVYSVCKSEFAVLTFSHRNDTNCRNV